MIDISTIITAVSVVVAIASFAVAAITLSGNRTKDVKLETREAVETHAQLQSQIDVLSNTIAPRLDTIDDGIRDLKAENRSTRNDITNLRDTLRDDIREVHDEAAHATELAEAAHRRLDRMGAEPDEHVRHKEA